MGFGRFGPKNLAALNAEAELVAPGSTKSSIQIKVNGTLTLQVLSTLDEINYVQEGSDITADALIDISGPRAKTKVKVSAWTSGDADVTFLWSSKN